LQDPPKFTQIGTFGLKIYVPIWSPCSVENFWLPNSDLSVIAGADDPLVVERVEGEVHDAGAVDQNRGHPVRDPAGLRGLEDGYLAPRAGQGQRDAIRVG
jgi:hypothetical protein